MAKKAENVSSSMFGGRSFKDMIIASTKRGDIFFALAIILMLVILICLLYTSDAADEL